MNTVKLKSQISKLKLALGLIFALSIVHYPLSVSADSAFPIRLACDQAVRQATPVDLNTGSSPVFVRGDDIEIQCGVLMHGSLVTNWGNVASMTLGVWQSQNDTNSPMILTNLPVASLNTLLTQANWTNGAYTESTNQHADFFIPGALTSINLNEQASQGYWLRIFLNTTDAPPKNYTLLEGSITVEDGPIESVSPPIPGPQYLTNYETAPVTLGTSTGASLLLQSNIEFEGSLNLLTWQDVNLFIAEAGNFTFNPNDEDNIGIGQLALHSLTTGNGNIAMDGDCLGSLTTGNQNIGIGNNAMQNVVDASFNIAFGENALFSLVSSGSDYSSLGNLALGINALSYITNGVANIGIGYDAGINYTSTESNNIVIANPGATGESGVIRIGTPGVQTKCYLVGTVIIPVNSGMTAPASISGYGMLWNSNNYLYWITPSHTNLLSAP